MMSKHLAPVDSIARTEALAANECNSADWPPGTDNNGTEISVPTLGESVTEATIGKWFKQAGDAVKADEPLVELETDKVTLEVPAPVAGVLSDITAKDGETVGVGACSAQIKEAPARAKPRRSREPAPAKPAASAAAPPSSSRRQTAGRRDAGPGERADAARAVGAQDRWPKTA